MDIKRYLQEKKVHSFIHTPTHSENFTSIPPHLTQRTPHRLIADKIYTLFQFSVTINLINICVKMEQYVPDFYSRETYLVYMKVYI